MQSGGERRSPCVLLAIRQELIIIRMKCKVCKSEAAVGLRSHNAAFCEKCFLDFFRRQVQRGIESMGLFGRKDKILVAVSGGKDSLSLMLELSSLGYNVTGLFVDLAIPDSSAQARSAVEIFCQKHGLELKIVDLAREGLAIPDIKRAVRHPICSVCGKIKRYYFDKMAREGGFDALATGHNLDDEVSRLMSNTLRWDQGYLATQSPLMPAANGFARKVKPLWRLTEFETANYAFLKGIEHHIAPCPYSAGASFSVLKTWVQKLEQEMPGRKMDFYKGFLERGKAFFAQAPTNPEFGSCPECGAPTPGAGPCSVCRLKQAVRELAPPA